MSRTMRRWLGNLLLLAVTLVVLDLLLGRVLGGSEHAMLYDPSGGVTGCCGQLRSSASIEYTGWFLRIPRIRQEVNALGYRGPERMQSKPVNVFRIVAVGDSYTYGLGTTLEESIPAQIESMLQRTNVGTVEVLNFGVPGAQLPDTIERVRCFASQWHPDMVLFFLYADDLESPLCEWKAVAQLGERLARSDLHALASDWRNGVRLVQGVATWKSSLVRAALLSYLLLARWKAAVNDESWAPQLEEHFQALIDTSRQAGATLAVVALGDPSAYRRTPRLGAMLDRQSVRWLDGRGWLFGAPEARLSVIPRDGHFNAEGNREAAKQIAGWLVSTNVMPVRTARNSAVSK